MRPANDQTTVLERHDVFTVPGRLPGLNELMLSRNARTGGKKKSCRFVVLCASGLKPWPGGVHMHLELYEPTRKRDPSNVYAGAVKVIEDALVQCGVLPGDGWRYVHSPASYQWAVDKENPRVVVHLSSSPMCERREAI